jgi:hypothetical protein
MSAPSRSIVSGSQVMHANGADVRRAAWQAASAPPFYRQASLKAFEFVADSERKICYETNQDHVSPFGAGFSGCPSCLSGLRFGRRIDRTQGLAKHLLTMVYWLLSNVIGTLVGGNPPKSVSIGPVLESGTSEASSCTPMW